MSTPATRLGHVINVTEIVDHAPFTPLHWRAFILCMACLVMDGFDVQALGYTAPSIIREWGVANAALGPVFAAANFGVLIGALLCSMLADRIGRRPVIVGAALFFGAMTLLTARVATVPQLLTMRFLAGVGLGTIVSNASSLVGEYSSKRMRATMIMYAGVGFTGGAAFGGFIAAALIPSYGWPSVVNFMNLLNLYSLASWLPTVVRDSGYSAQTGVLVGTVLQVGGTLGTVGLAWLVARGGFVRVMSTTFVLAAISVLLIGQPGISLALLYVIVFLAGWCVVGSQPGLNALSGAFYPTYIRSTGVGAGLGVGRIGAIVGPAIGGMFMAAHWSTRDIFLAAAIPAAISAVAMFSLRFVVGTHLGRVSAAN